jgi:RimJ/RimL family protein N-acetyltransferase
MSVMELADEFSRDSVSPVECHDLGLLQNTNTYWNTLFGIHLGSEMIGFIRVDKDHYNRSACIQLGFIREDKRGNGYYMHGKDMVLEFIFKKWGYNRVWSACNSTNEKMISINQGLKMCRFGVARSASYQPLSVDDGEFHHGYIDKYYFDILKHEYLSRDPLPELDLSSVSVIDRGHGPL